MVVSGDPLSFPRAFGPKVKGTRNVITLCIDLEKLNEVHVSKAIVALP